MSTISKTTFTFTVLHRTDDPFRDGLLEALARSQEGHAVGMETEHTSVPVPNQDVENELIELYNDGSFFDDDISEEVRASELVLHDRYQLESGDGWDEITEHTQHGDTILVTTADGTEHSLDIDEVVYRQTREQQ